MSLVAITLGIQPYRQPYSHKLAGSTGGRIAHERMREASDELILKALSRAPLTAVNLARKTGYSGWSGIRKNLASMVERRLLTKTGRLYSIRYD
jgi:hypothetical protein